ncbi:MarR family winged helix-turn-helix transcriptional regulator [Streptomyces sp. CA-106131]|uniref:MarR family winged helix-turn-helix transcriptional regulator n=1 Tax=Streptomyces sp. CA-106131 TaxID=3240045 RepID=UPI003D939725
MRKYTAHMITDSGQPALDPDHEAAWRTYLRAHALLERQLDRELRTECRITLNAYDALVQLSESPGRQLRMKDLADALVYSASGLTRVVDALERSGLATREKDPSDRRALLVTMTPEGLATLDRAWPVHLRGVNRYWADHLTAQQARTVQRVFAAVADEVTGSADTAS